MTSKALSLSVDKKISDISKGFLISSPYDMIITINRERLSFLKKMLCVDGVDEDDITVTEIENLDFKFRPTSIVTYVNFPMQIGDRTLSFEEFKEKGYHFLKSVAVFKEEGKAELNLSEELPRENTLLHLVLNDGSERPAIRISELGSKETYFALVFYVENAISHPNPGLDTNPISNVRYSMNAVLAYRYA